MFLGLFYGEAETFPPLSSPSLRVIPGKEHDHLRIDARALVDVSHLSSGMPYQTLLALVHYSAQRRTEGEVCLQRANV